MKAPMILNQSNLVARLIWAGLIANALCSSALAAPGAPGTLDATFNATGKVVTDFSMGPDSATSIAIQSDGKVVVAGGSSEPSGRHYIAIARYTSNGSLDTSFDGDGKRKFRTSIANDDTAVAVAVQPNGKILVAGTDYLADLWSFIIVRFNADGSVDSGFGGGGVVTIRNPGERWQATAMTIQPDGKIVVGGQAENNANQSDQTKFAIVRLTANGALDATFGRDGMATISMSTVCSSYKCWGNSAKAVKSQSDGRILLAGNAWDGNRQSFAIARLNTDGSQDNTFGTLGKIFTTVSTGAGPDYARAIAVRKDDRFVLAGSGPGSGRDFALARYNANGTPDVSFGTGGVMATSLSSGDDEITSLIAVPDGGIVAAGFSSINGDRDFAIVSYNADGSFDTTFGSGGVATTDFGSPFDRADAGVAQPSASKIVVAGNTRSGSGVDTANFALARYEFNSGVLFAAGILFPDHLKKMLPYDGGVLSAFESGLVYFSPDGQHLGGGGNTVRVYGGNQLVLGMVPHNSGVITAFSLKGIYFSPNGQHLGGGGNTTRLYPTGQPDPSAVTSMVPFENGVIFAFADGQIYFSPDGQYPHGGGDSIQVYSGTQTVVAMVRYQNGVVTAFSGKNIYLSPDGQNLGGGGNTIRVYPPSQQQAQALTAMLPYNGGVTAAFANGPVYFSPNGRDLGGGGNTRQVYSGTQTAVGMLEYNGGIFAAFSGRSIYFSPTGQNLGGGGNTMRVYPVSQQVSRTLTGMVRYNGGVITALYNQFSVTLEPSTAFFSPDGRNLGGDGNTSQVYP